MALLPLVFLSSCASFNKGSTNKVRNITNNLSVLFNLEQKDLWHPSTFKNQPVLFIDDENRMLFVFSGSSLETLDYDQWAKTFPQIQSTFDIIKFNKTQALIISLDRTRSFSAERLTGLILHESFHASIQTEENGWKKNALKQLRGDIYPFQSIPRYFRMEMYQSLIDYLENGEKIEALQHYSYWFWKWKKTFPEENDNYTDRIEGSAEYFTNHYLTLLKNKETSKKLTPFRYYKRSKTFSDLKEDFSLTMESYHLGVLSGIVLDSKLKHWKKEVTQGASPLKLLALLQTKKRQQTNNKLQSDILKISIKKMELVDANGTLDQAIHNLADLKKTLLIIPMNDVDSTSFTSSGMYRSFFNFKIISKVQFIKLLSPLELNHKNWQTRIPAGKVWIMAQNHPCSQKSPATIIPLDAKDFRFKNGNLKVLEPYLFEIRAKGLSDRRIFCAQPGAK